MVFKRFRRPLPPGNPEKKCPNWLAYREKRNHADAFAFRVSISPRSTIQLDHRA